MSNQKRIGMFLYGPFPRDGRVRREALSLSRQGHQVTIFAVSRLYEEPKEEVFHKIKIYRMFHLVSREARISPKTLFLFWLCCIVSVIRKKCVFDVIHCHDLPTLPAAIFIKIIRPVKVVYDSHEFFPDAAFDKLGFIYGIICLTLEKSLIRFADQIIGVSIPQSMIMKKRYSLHDFLIIRNSPMLNRPHLASNKGVNPLQLDKQKINIVNTGSLIQRRGHLTLLSSIVELKKQRLDFHLYFLGDGPLFPAIKSEIKRRNLQDFVTIVGFVSTDYYEVLSQFDIGICLYDDIFNNRYGLPNTLFDYALAGLAIVSPIYPGNYEIIREIGAIPVQPSNVGSLTDGLNQLLSDRKQISAKKKLSRNKFVEKLHWETLNKGLISLYAEL